MEHYRYLEGGNKKRKEDALAAKKTNEQVISDWQNRKMSELKERPEVFYKDSDTESQAQANCFVETLGSYY